MSLEEQIYAQALVMAGPLPAEQDNLLRVLCRAAKATLAERLRENLKPEDFASDFVTAASLFALAALSESDTGPREFTAGDLTVRKSDKNTAARCLRGQAELLMVPYVRDAFAFLGV